MSVTRTKTKNVLGGKTPTLVGQVEVLKITNNALLVRALGDDDLNGDGSKVWVSLSQICDDKSQVGSQSEEGDTGELVVPLWLAESNGWE